MNTKQYQKFTFEDIDAKSSKTFSFQIRTGYTFSTGLFFYSTLSMEKVKVSVKIDGNEILPVGTDMNLFRWTEGISRSEALWDFSKERIQCEGKRIEVIITNEGATKFRGSLADLYLLLENEIEE